MSARRAAKSGPVIALPLLALPLLGATPPTGADVTVEISHMRSTSGLVSACLAHAKAAFPDCSGAGGRALTVPSAKADHFTFRNVQPGRYAIAVLHDENGNGKVDKALMIPKEGFGFSRDAPIRMGPPPFAAAAFEVAGQDQSQPIRMRYIF